MEPGRHRPRPSRTVLLTGRTAPSSAPSRRESRPCGGGAAPLFREVGGLGTSTSMVTTWSPLPPPSRRRALVAQRKSRPCEVPGGTSSEDLPCRVTSTWCREPLRKLIVNSRTRSSLPPDFESAAGLHDDIKIAAGPPRRPCSPSPTAAPRAVSTRPGSSRRGERSFSTALAVAVLAGVRDHPALTPALRTGAGHREEALVKRTCPARRRPSASAVRPLAPGPRAALAGLQPRHAQRGLHSEGGLFKVRVRS